MPGTIPTEGRVLVANLLFKAGDVDRGVDLELGLFTNTTTPSTITAATLTEPTGGGYARKTLTDASWTNVDGYATYALQTFTATGSPFTGNIYGYFIVTKGTTPRIVSIEINTLGPHVIDTTQTYTVTPQITIS